MAIHIFGVRHHGPGSARSLYQALEKLQPDAILIEGPPEAESVLHLVDSPAMQPPVALLIYTPEQPENGVYYPFAIFSPEWQAMHYGLTNNVPVRFMDLPQIHRLAMSGEGGEGGGDEGDRGDEGDGGDEEEKSKVIWEDPLFLLADAAGYGDGESWWEHMVEQRYDSVDLFTAILEAMTAVRQELPPRNNPIEALREAYMRKTIREAEKQGFQNIAIVCGAWHTPALLHKDKEKEDTKLIKGLAKTKVEVTWIPWTYGRLSNRSGYGAGIKSPGWYHHLWESNKPPTKPTDQPSVTSVPHPLPNPSSSSFITISWMTQVAHLLREKDLDASPPQVIEAVRLAETLAALRDRPLPGLPELNEAIQTVFCFGSDLPMQLIQEKLIVSERLGKVPPETPMVPLQQDLIKYQKRLRMSPEPTEKILDLDLRKDLDLSRSHLLHRLTILDIPWGQMQQVRGKKGTFHEYWQLQWHPELALNLIEAGIWGNTIRDAAINKACDSVNKAEDLPTLTSLLNQVILSDLTDAVVYLMSFLENVAALTNDVTYLIAALTPLAKVLRYGNVRSGDSTAITHVVDGMVARICINLPDACVSLDDDAATAMYENIITVSSAIALLSNPEYTSTWQQALTQMADNPTLHGLIAGRCCRLLLDGGVLTMTEAGRRMGLALSLASEPSSAAAWVEGFLKDSGLLLLHDDDLWQVLDNWMMELPEETFIAILPLLRRTFSTFSAPERRQMGEKVKRSNGGLDDKNNHEFDDKSAALILPLVSQLLGL
ncbi:MAG: hypothetical protein KME64_25705 [Scytonematopsis contorta HA4267-MV1]|jgi:hypothetical protein|nr:hypothetical protein [Scytonematopsis contorta HA4267-MV1]